MHNTITGCTMMINRELAKKCLPIPNECIMHDWWIALIASAFGKIDYISESTIKYRQHSFNDTGAKKYNYRNIYIKALNLLFGDELYIKHLRKNIKQAESFLDSYKNDLDKDTISMLEDFLNIENKSFFEKRKFLLKYKLLKYGMVRNIGLLLRI